ncbi:MAG TPA: UDP-N-acetylmuramate--L-alanine ligase [Persephonella sp.]|uniref:UDP-N-acetylmuramate--L-alanine ligase n=1 Tax=Persephonella marina (strain DSM 14350 / EX-H1) TaxID=123214 RepID=MURC_PERMH|nr:MULTISPECIES: UDP-N-acetylmuramate--L-alanine ligase [Persephonella]C0QPY2.1 RecName: Full=UDP-N-acetylmuramate--L-alanine ligase; AltName: Full=UDP-N-acetylmuramoyl-L-alanine synthetase [Persephonella marina EX-H1]ACO03488.1 UDP-N-acetylmuramate--alanine ligase [Persephonella marina EX-H1]HCB69657.1 UDP-N-acetylmuramate--L-alanine ligase [Persephonella sp.]
MFRGKVRHIHFIGIGGSGMNGIAQVLLNQGFTVTGSDLKESQTVINLKNMGAKIYIGHDPKNVDGADVVVYSSAVKQDNPELLRAKQLGIPTIPRGEMLAELMRFKYGIAIAGSHGKTTTTSMVGTILGKTGYDPTVVIGGKLEAYGSNAKLGSGDFIVTEADESDGSFLKLTPTIVSINNIDLEHIGFYKNLNDIKRAFIDFANKVPFYGAVAVNIDDQNIKDIIPEIEKKIIRFGISEDSDIRGYDLRLENGRYRFKVNDFGEIYLSIPGKHNVYNALAAISISVELGVPFCVIKEALENFKNANRRFEIKYDGSVTVIDDYAHHPTEIKATLSATREMFDGRRIIAVFQPHRYSRTFSLYDHFVRSFNIPDITVITEIFPAGESPIDSVNGEKLSSDIKKETGKTVLYGEDLQKTFNILKNILKKDDVLLILGAGNVTRLSDQISQFLKNKEGALR